MKVYFVRHATASSKAHWARDDALRPLTRAGRARFSAAVVALVSAGVLHPDRIVTSPLLRARQTAELLRHALPVETALVEDDRLALAFDSATFWQLVADNADARSLAIVGHNPSFSTVLSEVTGGSDAEMRKGAIALVEIGDIADRRATLAWLAPPSLFTPVPESAS